MNLFNYLVEVAVRSTVPSHDTPDTGQYKRKKMPTYLLAIGGLQTLDPCAREVKGRMCRNSLKHDVRTENTTRETM